MAKEYLITNGEAEEISTQGGGGGGTIGTNGTVDGLVNFTTSPTVPTAEDGDSSTKAASTQFVAKAIAPVKSTADAAQTTANAALPKSGGVMTGEITIGGETFVHVQNTAGAHNAIYRYENLESKFTLEQLTTKLNNADFSDIYVGNYIEREINSSIGGKETVRFLVAGIDTFLKNGDTEVTRHHLTMVPEDCFKTTAQMNSTNTTNGGYKGCAMHNNVLPAYATAIKNALGASHMLNHKQLLSNSMSASLGSMAGAGYTGASNNWEWVSVDLCLLSEIQVYGSTVFSSSFFDIGNRNQMLPLFQLAQDKKVAGLGKGGSRCDWWLGAVTSSTTFALVSVNGLSDAGGASLALGVRPLFLFI